MRTNEKTSCKRGFFICSLLIIRSQNRRMSRENSFYCKHVNGLAKKENTIGRIVVVH